MKRKAVEHSVAPLLETLGISNCRTEIWIDTEHKEEIETFLNIKKNKKKFKRQLYEMCSNRYSEDLYGKEEVSKKAKHVTALKFKGRENVRIGCKEFFKNGKKIVMIVKFIKKSQKNTRKIKNIYETIGGYDYDFK